MENLEDDESEFVEEEEDMECELFDDQGYSNQYPTAYYDYMVESDEDENMPSADPRVTLTSA